MNRKHFRELFGFNSVRLLYGDFRMKFILERKIGKIKWASGYSELHFALGTYGSMGSGLEVFWADPNCLLLFRC